MPRRGCSFKFGGRGTSSPAYEAYRPVPVAGRLNGCAAIVAGCPSRRRGHLASGAACAARGRLGCVGGWWQAGHVQRLGVILGQHVHCTYMYTRGRVRVRARVGPREEGAPGSSCSEELRGLLAARGRCEVWFRIVESWWLDKLG